MISVENLSIAYTKDRKVIDNIDFKVKPGQLNILMGRNGAGKSTILDAINGSKDYTGKITTEGEISYLNQQVNTNISFTVFETVVLGKVKNLSIRLTDEDIHDTHHILKMLGIYDLRDKNINQLSGGQVQVVLIAQALVNRPDIVLMDEPVSALDLKNQYEIMCVIKELTLKKKLTTLITLHQIELAERFSDHLILIKDGKKYMEGPKEKVFTQKMFKEVYHIDSIVEPKEDRIQLYFKEMTKFTID